MALQPNQVRARVTRGVYIRGKAYAPGTVLTLPRLEFIELRSHNYVVEAGPEPAPQQKELDQWEFRTGTTKCVPVDLKRNSKPRD